MCAAPFGRRPRPVTDVPGLDGHELARAWLVELVAAAPLERAAALPGPGFAAHAPRLCEAVAEALASDPVLDDLAQAPLTADAAVLAGAESVAEAVAALDLLRKVLWGAILLDLRDPDPRHLAEVADRLGVVTATVTAAALDGGAALRHATRPGERGPLASVLRPAGEPGGVGATWARGAAAAAPDAAAAPEAPAAPVLHEVPGDGVAPWTAAVQRRLVRHSADGNPFAVLCLEVADLDRLVASEHDRDVALALESAEAAVYAQLRPADVLVRERPGRLWLVAPETDGESARALAHLIAAAVAGVPGHHGAPLEAAVGLATCPQDGLDAPALEGRAEEGLFAARAAGLRVVGPPV